MSNVINVTLENFQQVMLEESQQKLIMVDFWVSQSEPCQRMAPVLEKLATEYANSLILARVNCEEQPQITAQFGVRDLPTVILVKEGQPVDGFAGEQTEPQIREFLQKHLPSPADELMDAAKQAAAENNLDEVASLAKQALDFEPERADIKFTLASAYIQLGHIAQAKAVMETVGLVDQDSTYQSIMGQIELAEEAADTPEIQALQAQLEQDPDNMELKIQLGVQLQQAKRTEEALELFFEVLKKDMNFGDARKLALDTINALPAGDPLASQYRRKIYSLMY